LKPEGLKSNRRSLNALVASTLSVPLAPASKEIPPADFLAAGTESTSISPEVPLWIASD